MKFVIAPDSFKESMSALSAAKAIETGIRRVLPEAVCEIVPMADGGEGTADCLMYSWNGEKISCRATGPMGEPVDTDFVWLRERKTAVIEMARTCGIMLVAPDRRDPLRATTYGIGELMRIALDKGCREIVLTLGGSVTNDGGAGMLEALGAKLLDEAGRTVGRGGEGLRHLAHLDLSLPRKLLAPVRVTVLCDVSNCLLGEQGATYIFGPQKGATDRTLPMLEAAMEHYAGLIDHEAGLELSGRSGTGAAGGLGYGLLAVCQAEFVSGSEYVMRELKLEEKIRQTDYVITGEGAMDVQSLGGKVPISVAKVARKYQKPVVAFVGKLTGDMEPYYESGITAVFSILRGVKPMKELLAEGEANLSIAAENFVRVLSEQQ